MLHHTLARHDPIQANCASNRTLTTLRFHNIHHLVVIPHIEDCVVNVAFLIIIRLQRSNIGPNFRHIRIRQMKVRRLFVSSLFPIPTFLRVSFMNMYLLHLFTTPTSSVTILPMISAVNVTIVLIIRLLCPTSQPANMPFQVNRHLLPLQNVKVGIKVNYLRAHPFTTIRCTIVIHQQMMITRNSAPLLAPNSVPPLHMMISHHLIRVIHRPKNGIMITRVRRSHRIILATRRIGRRTTRIVLHLLRRHAMVIVRISSLTSPTTRRLVRQANLRRNIAGIPSAYQNRASARIMRIISIILRILLNRVTQRTNSIIRRILPISITCLQRFRRENSIPISFRGRSIQGTRHTIHRCALRLRARTFHFITSFRRMTTPMSDHLQ